MQDNNNELEMTTTRNEEQNNDNPIHRRKSNTKYSGVSNQDNPMEAIEDQEVFHDEDDVIDDDPHHHSSQGEEMTKTYDLISITNAVFEKSTVSRLVIIVYYMSLFLVLGDYILVMARAVSAMFLDQICIPTAGAIASILMFAICQLKTMAHIGRAVSLASLLAMLVVLLQCLFHHRNRQLPPDNDDDDDPSIWQKFSAFASIGFAVGSQKLFLNIRHELRHREQAPQALAWSLTTYGVTYLLVITLAGPSRCYPAWHVATTVFPYYWQSSNTIIIVSSSYF
jgi:hypothetical protein